MKAILILEDIEDIMPQMGLGMSLGSINFAGQVNSLQRE